MEGDLSMSLDSRKSSDKRTTLQEAISHLQDGNSLAFGGMGGSQCVAQVYEVVRQGKQDLTLIGDSPCEVGDFLCGSGQLKKMEIAWCGYAVAGLADNFRRAIEAQIPREVVLEEYSNYTIGLRFMAGALNVPFFPTKSLLGSDLIKYNDKIKVIDDPYGSGEKLALVPAAIPDVGIIHVNRADKRGNSQIFGYSANGENIARAAKYTIVTCEEIVTTDEIRKNSSFTVIPEYCVDAVVELPYACHPWNFPYAYAYDMPFHMDQLKLFKTREGFEQWMQEYCYDVGDHEGYLKKVGYDRLNKLSTVERKFMKLRY
jgi:glutaconate CoA-transferase subunit A